MRTYDRSHLSDSAVLQGLARRASTDKTNTADFIADIAEVDARRLYAQAGFSSTYDYCIRVLHLSEQAALKRIRVGRVARRFPAIFPALADGRLHLSAVLALKHHLTRKNAKVLLDEAEHKTRTEIEFLLAQRFPKEDVPTQVSPITEPASLGLSPGTPDSNAASLSPGTPAQPRQLSPGTTDAAQSRVKPLAPQRFALQVTLDQETHDLLRRALELSSHGLPSGDVLEILKRALKGHVRELEKRKFAATDKPRASRRATASVRGIPAHVRRAVSKRDQNQCTFVSDSGHRCGARKFVEFDHIEPVALGGRSSIENLRLRCRAHNQLEADRTFGEEFMEQKRQRGRFGRAQAQGAQIDSVESPIRAEAAERSKDIVAGLRGLGLRVDQARRAAEYSATLPNLSLPDQMRAALQFHGTRVT